MDKKDLVQIGEVVARVIQGQVPSMIEKGINDALEQVVMPQFDLLHERIDVVEKDVAVVRSDVAVLKRDVAEIKQDVVGFKNQSSIKGWVEDRLDNFRIDHGLKYKPSA